MPDPEDRQPRYQLVGRFHEAMEMLGGCAVDLVLAGHLHYAYGGYHTGRDGEPTGVYVLQASTANSTRVKKSPNAFNRISIQPAAIVIQAFDWQDGGFVEGARNELARNRW